MALGSIFGGFWDHLGRQVGTKMAPKSKKMRVPRGGQKMSGKKELQVSAEGKRGN